MEKQLLEKFSPSMILDYIACPKAFYYKYIAQVKLPQKQIHLLFGSAVHAAIENIYANEEPYGMFDITFDIDKLTNEEKKLYEEYVALGREMIKNYIEEHKMLDKIYSLNSGESEKYVRKNLINPLTKKETSIPMSGRIDRMTDDGIIVEYKTSKNAWNPKETRYKIQTLMYNLWYYSEYKTLPKETLYIILLKKYKNPTRKNDKVIQVLSNHSTVSDIASMYDEIELILEKINNREFSEPTGFHPRWCDCFRFDELLNFNNRK